MFSQAALVAYVAIGIMHLNTIFTTYKVVTTRIVAEWASAD